MELQEKRTTANRTARLQGTDTKPYHTKAWAHRTGSPVGARKLHVLRELPAYEMTALMPGAGPRLQARTQESFAYQAVLPPKSTKLVRLSKSKHATRHRRTAKLLRQLFYSKEAKQEVTCAGAAYTSLSFSQ